MIECGSFICVKLSVIYELCQFNRLYNLAVLAYTHIAGSNLVYKYNLVVVVAELELDIPEVETDGLKVVCNNFCNLESAPSCFQTSRES